MLDILNLLKKRRSSRVPFDPNHHVSVEDVKKILEGASWSPTAHNMQNYEVVVVDDQEKLHAIGDIKSGLSEAFIRENYQQLSFSEEELRQKKTGVIATMFPPHGATRKCSRD